MPNISKITLPNGVTYDLVAPSAKKLENYYTSRPTSANLLLGDGSVVNFKATSSMTTGKPANDSHILHLSWDNTGGFDSQVAVSNGGTTPSWRLGVRSQNSGTWSDWIYVLDSTNYGNYCIKKDSDNGTSAIYWKEVGYGDKFQIKPQFSGSDDSNYLAINGAVGGAGTDPSLYELMRITGKTGKLQVKGEIYYSGGVRRCVGSYTDSTFYIANELMTFKSSNNAIVTGGKGNYIWGISSWSDSRLKKNIKDSKVNALDIINKIQMREFDFKDEKYGTHEDIGYVAHELREIIPECVVDIPISEEEQKKYKTDTLMQVEDKHLIKYLVKAVQELSKEVEKLKGGFKNEK